MWLGWPRKTAAVMLPIASQSIKRSVKLTDEMTCLDCSLYMRSEKNGPHQSVKGIDSIVCIKYGKKPLWKPCGCDAGSAVLSHGHNTIVEMYEYCLVVHFYCSASWKSLYVVLRGVGVGVFVHRFHCLPLCGHLLAASLVMFGRLYYIFLPTQHCNNSAALCNATRQQHYPRELH